MAATAAAAPSRASGAQSRDRRKTGPTAKRPPSKKRFGCETPRIYTKPLRKLTPKTSLGFSVIEFAETVLLITLLPWQKWLLVHMLELLPDNTLRFRTVIVLVARQNGKSTLSQVLALWFMYVYGVPLVIGTAQDLDIAEEIWQGAVDLINEEDDFENPIRPDLKAMVKKVNQTNGKKALILKTGERWKVKATNRGAGRSLTGDLVMLDELREHQTWDAWGALTKTTMARAMALILCLSNAGDASSVVLRYLRQMCIKALVEAGEDEWRAELGDVDEIIEDALDEYAEEGIDEAEFFANEGDDSTAIFEWSAPPGCDLWNRDGWAQANPSMGYTITERAIASACRTDPEWVFRTEVLCQWSEGTLEGPFPPGAWEKSADGPDENGKGGSMRAPDAPVALGVDVSWDRSHSHIGLASRREDGQLHIEVIASRTGTDWVIPWLTAEERSTAVKEAPVAVQAKGAPASSLIKGMQAAGVNVVEWGGSDLGAGCGSFYDLVRAAIGEGEATTQLRHRNQGLLNVAAATASTKPMGDAWVWDRRKSPVDVAPLLAVTGATWCLLRPAEKPKPKPRIRVIGG